MEISKQSVKDFMSSRNSLIVPVYQRNYAWDEQDCGRLFDDIANIHDQQLKAYFLGACVVVTENPNELLLIDGQQRITSLAILLVAIYDLLKKTSITSLTNATLAEEILEDYLVNKRKQDTADEYIRLKQVNQDRRAYRTLLLRNDEDEDELKHTLISKNYALFKRKIEVFCRHKNIDSFWAAFHQLEIAVITLKTDHGDKPQQVFETINSTGKSLADADLIRNFVLMGQSHKIQTKIFDNYWTKIEQSTLIKKGNKYDSKTTEAIRYYLIFETGKYISDKKVYAEFVRYFKQQKANEQDIEIFLEKLRRFSEYYRWFAVECPTPEFEEYLAIVRHAGHTTSYSYFMHLMDANYQHEQDNQAGLNKTIIVEALQFINDYFIRRELCNLTTTGYSKLYPRLTANVKDTPQSDYINAL